MGDEHNTRLMRTPKEGERILAPTRRPDGTLRKPIRIRAGYTPQDEVAIYKSKGTLMRKSAEVVVPPGYEPSMDAKLKTKSAKRNERKKEKKLQTNHDVITVYKLQTYEAITSNTDSLHRVPKYMFDLGVQFNEFTRGNEMVDVSSDVLRRIIILKMLLTLIIQQQQSGQKSLPPEGIDQMEDVDCFRAEYKRLDGKSTNEIYNQRTWF
ncbi:hypothetical protein KSP40_PGU020720 [Platanthera guangdongensis]|uniref:WIBG Mago-binding domain-containing protein n=1 Tax=Platanthera guangdongensis TaxID=2320717 RepID=A0ABR2MR51_9ASPA